MGCCADPRGVSGRGWRPSRPGTSWTLDKSLYPWRYLPWLAAVLPDARYLHVERDPRDRAISMYLSAFHATQWAFTSSLEAIRRCTIMERQLVPEAVQALRLRALKVQYEELVDDPAGQARRMLEHLGLEFEPAVLAPEENQRAVLTLSSQQVRRSINRASIGRWKNYAFAFGPEWDQLASKP
ncbi:MAG: sulfotransferase [Phycisphaerales bacterium]